MFYYLCGMSKKILYILLVSPFIYTSCNNDLEVIGEWKETAIVYGLLNPGDSVNYVRVEKAFLGEGNALLMAQHSDSIYYGSNVSVVLERRKNGQVLSTLVMERDSTIPKEPGTFANDGHVVYKTSQKIFSDSDYSLIVHNEQNGYTATAHTPIVDSLTFVNPTPSPLVQTVSWVDNNGPTPIDVRWITGADSKVFELAIRFYYAERKLADLTADTNVIELRYPKIKTINSSAGQNLNITVTGDEFFNFLKTKLGAPPADYYRVAHKVEFILNSGAEEFSIYLDVIGASPGISQTAGVYTNINNGLGIFSSRTTQNMTKGLNSLTKDYLACNQDLKFLRFLKSNQQVCP